MMKKIKPQQIQYGRTANLSLLQVWHVADMVKTACDPSLHDGETFLNMTNWDKLPWAFVPFPGIVELSDPVDWEQQKWETSDDDPYLLPYANSVR